MRLHRWWHYALFGAAVLVFATARNAVQDIPRLFSEGLDGAEAAVTLGVLLLAGATCGALAWGLRELSRRLGLVGDGLIGVAIVVVFASFGLLALPWVVEEPVPVYQALVYHGLPVFALVVALGFVVGAWFGRGIREAEAEQGPDPDVDIEKDVDLPPME